MTLIDIVLGLIMALFLYIGFKNGFVKKIIGIICLVLALILATKFSAYVAELLFGPMGISGRIGFALAFLTIVIGITLTQSLLYKLLIKDLVEGVWNRIGGIFIGFIEGALTISIALILMSIYLKLPSDETKANSTFYKPLKNFAPMAFDQLNTFLPESEDFYQQLFNAAAEEIKKGEKKP